MRLAVDTNRYVDLCRGSPEVVRTFEEAEEVYAPFVVLAELRCGFAVGRHGAQNEGLLRQMLLKPDVRVLYGDEQTTHLYAAVYRQLRIQGTPVPTNDMWIAALVLQHSLVPFDRDRHFDHLPQIVRV